MGIQGLLPFLKEASESVHIRKYKGYTVGVDTYCWIHRGAIGCATQLAKGEPADHYVRYCVKYVNMLRALDIKPVLVFDGRNLPAKASVEESRRERRETYNRKGRQFLREGKASEARDCFVKSINVTPEMALDVMKAVRSLGVDCIVAPYEADAQLAYLEKHGIVQAVITEDSDLIAFGCKRVIVKLDLAGNCLDIDSSNLNQAMKIGEKFTADKFRYMCIVAGCDYLSSLPGIGIGKARKLFHLTSNPDISQVIKRMATTLKMKTTVPPEYVEGFKQANNTFLYQLAFDPRKKKLQPLNPYPPEVEPSSLTYAGKYVAEDKAYQMALGNLNFNTMSRMCDFDPEVRKLYERTKTPRHKLSIWHEHYQPGPGLGCTDPVLVEREITRGKVVTVEMRQRMVQRKRQREDVEEPTPISDMDLSSMYTNHGHGDEVELGETKRIIPETPEKENEEVKPAKRNRFARKVLAKKRMDILNSGEVVTSRFFTSSKAVKQERQQVEVKREHGTEEEKETQLNTSGLLEGIAHIEQEQERQFKPDNNSEDTLEGHQDSDTELHSEDPVIILEEDTHVAKSLEVLQRFQRSCPGPKILKQDVRASSTPGSRKAVSSTPEHSALKSSGYRQESQESIIDSASSQNSMTSLKGDSCSQSFLSSSQRQGTPRPRSAFSWSRKKELQDGSNRNKNGQTGSSQTKQSSLSSFAFRPNSAQVKLLHRSASFTAGSQEQCQNFSITEEKDSQKMTLSRTDSCESNMFLLSQESNSSSMFPSSSCVPGSMDMAQIKDDHDSRSRVVFIDSQSSSSSSIDTSSFNLSSSQPSISPSQDLSQSLQEPPLPSLPDPRQPSFQLRVPLEGIEGSKSSDEGVAGPKDAECEEQYDGEGGMEEASRMRGMLSRKRKYSQVSKEESSRIIPNESSSPDTDALSLDPSSSQRSSSSEEVKPSILTTSPNHSNGQNNSLKSQPQLKKRNCFSIGSPENSSKYFASDNQEGLINKTKQGTEKDVESAPESENMPPVDSKLPVSPSRGMSRSVKLLGDRNGQVLGIVADPVDSPAQKKPSSLLGRCKASGLSKKRRPSSKQTPTNTPKGQTSLLAFMSKQKTRNEVPKPAMTDLTPELEGSLLSRQEHITSKRNIFN